MTRGQLKSWMSSDEDDESPVVVGAFGKPLPWKVRLRAFWASGPRARLMVLGAVAIVVLAVGTLASQGVRKAFFRADSRPATIATKAAAGPAPAQRNNAPQVKGDDSVRLLGSIAKNGTKVSYEAMRAAVEFEGWRYVQYCYNGVFGRDKNPPAGTITLDFDVVDKRPVNVKATKSDFDAKEIDDCVVATLSGQTVARAVPGDAGHVTYQLKFAPL